MTAPRMSAVVVAWNSGGALAQCVDSLRASARQADEPLELVVVDNGSTDTAVDELRARAAGRRDPQPAQRRLRRRCHAGHRPLERAVDPARQP